MTTTILMAGGFAIAAYAFCANYTTYAQCALFAGAAGLGGAVIASIMKSHDSNQQMYRAVTVGSTPTTAPCVSPCVPSVTPTTTVTTGPGPGDGAGNPGLNQYRNTMANLSRLGVTATPKGVVTLPNGTTKNLGDMSTGALRAAGYSSKDIAAFNSAAASIKAKAELAAKGADSHSDLYGDSAGGAGSSGKNGAGHVADRIPTGPRSSVDRNPAQVAGMARDLNGQPIGVSADDVWKMMNRRYQLQEKNGSFLSPGP